MFLRTESNVAYECSPGSAGFGYRPSQLRAIRGRETGSSAHAARAGRE